MDTPVLVRVRERVGERDEQRAETLEWQGFSVQRFRQRLALDALHDDERGALDLLERVDRRDIRVVELRRRLGLPPEHLQPLGVVRDRLREHFDRDLAVQLGVAREINLAHSTLADGRENLVRAELRSDVEGHRHRNFGIRAVRVSGSFRLDAEGASGEREPVVVGCHRDLSLHAVAPHERGREMECVERAKGCRERL